MGLRSIFGLLTVALAFSFFGCRSDGAQKVQPETRGKRGERCQARNDCDAGLACLNGVCAKNEFSNVEVHAKHCDLIECEADADCCGDRPTTAPAECEDRQNVCLTPTLPDCTVSICTSDATCGSGTCPMGACSIGGGACESSDDCADVCVAGTCRVSGQVCTVATQAVDCFYYGSVISCSTRACDCQNPDFDPTDELCFNQECLNVCLLRCNDNNRCIEDDSCDTAVDCAGTGLPICDGGRCVQCVDDDDCNEDNQETCERGQCRRPCEFNEQCALFEECNTRTGDCEYVGCKSNHECILAAARGQGVDGGNGVGDDPRLFECLPSEANEDIKTCKIPCENDGSCGHFQVCDAGYCKFIGCDSHEECRAYLGITNQVITETKPYVAQARCVE